MPKIKKSQGFAILLLTFCWYFEAPALGSALGIFAVEFPEASKLTIQFAFMGPYLTAMVFSPIAGRLSDKIDKRTVALTGLLIYAVTGFAPFFAHSMTTIVILRLITGIGVGLVMPIPNAYIYERYSHESRGKMLGYTSAFSNGATIIAALGSGYAVVYGGWRGCFVLFVLIFLIFLYCLPFLPKTVSIQKEESEESLDTVQKAKISELPPKVFLYMFFIILLYIIFSFANSNFSMYIIGNGWGDASQAGLCLCGMSVGAIAGGLLFNYMVKALKGWFAFVSMVIFAVSYLLFVLADGLTLLAIGGFFAGFGSAIILPYYLAETAKTCKPEQADLAYGFVTTGINVGAVLCPFIQALIGSIAGNSELPVLSMVSLAVIAIAALCSLTYLKKKHA